MVVLKIGKNKNKKSGKLYFKPKSFAVNSHFLHGYTTKEARIIMDFQYYLNEFVFDNLFVLCFDENRLFSLFYEI